MKGGTLQQITMKFQRLLGCTLNNHFQYARKLYKNWFSLCIWHTEDKLRWDHLNRSITSIKIEAAIKKRTKQRLQTKAVQAQVDALLNPLDLERKANPSTSQTIP